jgi:nucleotide-binding universal stress UspA family protein
MRRNGRGSRRPLIDTDVVASPQHLNGGEDPPMKSFLIPIGGSDTDAGLFETALAAARPFSSHMNFLHVHVGPGEAALNSPHTGFAMGPALSSALAELDTKAQTRAELAARHFREFCAKANVEIRDAPVRTEAVTASWREEDGSALPRILFHARHHDLVVVGRAKSANGLPSDFLDQLLVGCGRPVLIAGPATRSAVGGTVMVCWKESSEAARAVNAAMPLLRHARQVVVVSIAENGDDPAEALAGVARHLAWNGVTAELRTIPSSGGGIPALLSATAHECGADLVVLGAYGHSRVHEILFGSCTQSVIRNAETSVLLMH